jgi:hypothetical protein
MSSSLRFDEDKKLFLAIARIQRFVVHPILLIGGTMLFDAISG